jgi:hypothetical protein
MHISSDFAALPANRNLGVCADVSTCVLAHAGAPFSSLQALLCANNRISDWATVQSLAALPLLSDLRLSGNPLFTTGGGERFEVAFCSSVCNAMSPFRLLPATCWPCKLPSHHMRTKMCWRCLQDPA